MDLSSIMYLKNYTLLAIILMHNLGENSLGKNSKQNLVPVYPLSTNLNVADLMIVVEISMVDPNNEIGGGGEGGVYPRAEGTTN